MNTALVARIRAARAEMDKPGRWRVAFDQLEQAAAQLLSSPQLDIPSAKLLLEQLYALYQWSAAMQSHELRRLNVAVLRLSSQIYQS